MKRHGPAKKRRGKLQTRVRVRAHVRTLLLNCKIALTGHYSHLCQWCNMGNSGSCLRSPVQMSIRIKLGRRFNSPAFGGKRFGSRHQLKQGWVKIWRRVITFKNTEKFSLPYLHETSALSWWSVTNVMLIVTNASPPRMYSQLGVVCPQLLPTGPPEVQHWCCHWAEAQNWSWDKAQISKLGLCPRFERIHQNHWHTFERIYSIL